MGSWLCPVSCPWTAAVSLQPGTMQIYRNCVVGFKNWTWPRTTSQSGQRFVLSRTGSWATQFCRKKRSPDLVAWRETNVLKAFKGNKRFDNKAHCEQHLGYVKGIWHSSWANELKLMAIHQVNSGQTSACVNAVTDRNFGGTSMSSLPRE